MEVTESLGMWQFSCSCGKEIYRGTEVRRGERQENAHIRDELNPERAVRDIEWRRRFPPPPLWER